MPITGTGIPAGSVITAIVPGTSITLNQPATAAGTVSLTAGGTTGMVVGMGITGTGIPAGATVASITDANTFVLSTAATATNTAQTFLADRKVTNLLTVFGGGVTSENRSITGSQTQIAPNALALAAGATTSGSPNVTVTSTAGLLPGMAVYGAGIPAGATVSSVTSGTAFVLSTNATATASALTLGAGGTFIGGASTTSGQTAVTVASTAGLAVGMPISGPGIAAGSTIGAITSGTTLTLSTAATATGSAQILTAGGQSNVGTLRIASSGSGQSFSLGNSSLALGSGSGAILFTGADAYSITSSALTAVSISATTNSTNSVTVASTAGLYPGMPITGTGIPAGAYITSITDNTKFLISAAATTSATNTLYASGVTGALTGGAAGDLIIHQYGAQALTINAPIADNAAGNSINLVKNGTGQLTLGRPPVTVTSGTAYASGATTLALSTTGLSVGMYVVGPGIAPNTKITAIGAYNQSDARSEGDGDFSAIDFLRATNDRHLKTRTGELLWERRMEASAHATPITYTGEDGRQFVTVVTTGGSFLNSPLSSDTITAFALPTGE
jgi:hypothetical protein